MRVVIASEESVVADLLNSALNDAEFVDSVTSVTSVAGLRRACLDGTTRVVVSTMGLAGGGLIAAVGDVLSSGSRVIVIYDDTTEDPTALLFAGASGCLAWSTCRIDDLVTAVRTVADGQAALSPAAAAAVLDHWRTMRETPADAPAPRVVALSVREREVLTVMSRGLPTKSIGRELGVSPKTIEAHIGRILSKLDARNRAHAVSIARRHGLLGNIPCS